MKERSVTNTDAAARDTKNEALPKPTTLHQKRLYDKVEEILKHVEEVEEFKKVTHKTMNLEITF